MNHRISGCHGFVVIPDGETIQAAKDLVRRMVPNAKNKMEDYVHLSLYYAMLEMASPELIGEVLQILRTKLIGKEISLGSVQVYAGHYLDWVLDVDLPDLNNAHYASLASLDLHRAEKFSTFQIDGFQDLNPREQANMERYDHPLVLEQFRQQLTLASDPQGIELESTTVRRVGMIADVHFVRFGMWECIEHVLSQPSAKN
ncbi:MAG: hypothetical protein PHC70_00480 [Patescibacteria group bacterium]|nr:hypothetical protein [Patescibacteria group bacterium]